jgi:hypothetical protein
MKFRKGEERESGLLLPPGVVVEERGDGVTVVRPPADRRVQRVVVVPGERRRANRGIMDARSLGTIAR